AVERGSEHPLASAILGAAEARRIDIPRAVDFSSAAGKGVAARVDGRRVDLGSAEFMKTLGVDLGTAGDRARGTRQRGSTVLVVSVDGRLAGLIAVSDPIRATTPEAVRMLRDDGLHIVMVTGDHRVTAQAIATQLGIDDVRADVLPDQKREIVAELQ